MHHHTIILSANQIRVLQHLCAIHDDMTVADVANRLPTALDTDDGDPESFMPGTLVDLFADVLDSPAGGVHSFVL